MENELKKMGRLSKTIHYARRALLVQYFLMGFIFSTMLSRLPALRDSYGTDTAGVSLVFFSMSIGSLILMPFCPYLMGRYGCKNLSVMGFAYMTLFALLPFMPNIYVLYGFCAIYGMTVSITDLSVNGNSIIVENAYKRPIISMFHAMFYVGMFSGSIFSVIIMHHGVSIGHHFCVVSCLALMLFFFLRQRFLKETPSRVMKQGGFKLLFPKGILLLIAFIALLGRIVEGSISDWSTVYMEKVVKLGAEDAPLGLAIYSAFMSIGRFFGDTIRARYKDSVILLGCCSLASIGLLIMIAKPDFIYAVVGLFVAGLGISCLVPIIYSLAGRQKDITPAMGLAMVSTISSLGFLFGPYVIGTIADLFGMRTSFCYVFFLALLMVALSSLYWRKERR